jgi:polysaccharide export outer membrane protein
MRSIVDAFKAAPKMLCAAALTLVLAACATGTEAPSSIAGAQAPDYRIGPLDTLQIFVWRSPDLTTSVPVRPDGRISTPLIEDLEAAGKTPTQLARDIEQKLSTFVQDPVVTVIVGGFNGPFDQQVRVVGEAAQPQAIPYRANMSVLDVMIAVRGLNEFAAGNRAVLVRGSGPNQQSFRLRLDDLLRDGDISANAPVMPGDVIIVPQSWL